MISHAWLEDLLVHPKTKEALRKVSQWWFDIYRERHSSRHDALSLDSAFLRASASMASLNPWGVDAPSFAEVLHSRVFAKLEHPLRVLPGELKDMAAIHLITVPSLFEGAYEKFVGACRGRLDATHPLVEEFDVVSPSKLGLDTYAVWSPWGQIDRAFFDTLPITELFDGNDALVTVQTFYDTHAISFDEQPMLQCRVEASAWSSSAFVHFVEQIREILPTVLQTLVLGLHFSPPDGLDPRVDPDSLPPVRADQTGWDLVRFLVELHFQTIPKKHTLVHRLQTAQQLILESDQSRHASVGTVLCFAALESLLLPEGNQGQISESLARAATNLLQPEPKARRGNRDAIKRLYHLRSRLVHGSSAAEDVAARDRARLLVAGAVKGVLEWARFRQRLGEEPVRAEDLLEALKDADDGKQMIGVPDALAGCLPE